MRVAVAEVVGVLVGGACHTTSIALGIGLDKGPCIAQRIELLESWRDLWNQSPAVVGHYSRCLGSHPTKRLTDSTWRRVAGPKTAIQATLNVIGWIPLRPDRWQDSQGTQSQDSSVDNKHALHSHMVDSLSALA